MIVKIMAEGKKYTKGPLKGTSMANAVIDRLVAFSPMIRPKEASLYQEFNLLTDILKKSAAEALFAGTGSTKTEHLDSYNYIFHPGRLEPLAKMLGLQPIFIREVIRRMIEVRKKVLRGDYAREKSKRIEKTYL